MSTTTAPIPQQIDVIMTSEWLTAAWVKWQIYGTDHGSDHRAIESEVGDNAPGGGSSCWVIFVSVFGWVLRGFTREMI